MKYRFVFFIVVAVLISLSACSTSPTPINQAPLTQQEVNTPTTLMTPVPTSESAGGSSMDPYSYDDGGDSSTASVTNPVTTGADNAAFFQDNLATADMFVLNLNAVAPAPAGQSYQGWLRNEDGSLTNIGLLEPQPDNTLHLEWTATDGRNLAASVVGIQITLEPAGGSEQPAGKIVFAGAMTSEHVNLLRSLFVSNTGQPATPRNKAFALALVQQMNLAMAHADNALNAEAIGAARERSLHLEHFINIIEGSKGERFKDYDGDGSAQNPGDGFGVLAYAQQIQEKLANPEITALVGQMTAALVNLEQQTIAILESQPGAPSLKDLRLAIEGVQSSLVINLYLRAEQVVAFPVIPVP